MDPLATPVDPRVLRLPYRSRRDVNLYVQGFPSCAGRRPQPVMRECGHSGQSAADACGSQKVGMSIRHRVDALAGSEQVTPIDRTGEKALLRR